MELSFPSKILFINKATSKMSHNFIFVILMRKPCFKIIAAGGLNASTIKEPKHFIEKHDKPTCQLLLSFFFNFGYHNNAGTNILYNHLTTQFTYMFYKCLFIPFQIL